MGIKPEHLDKYVIEPTLKEIGLYSISAGNLLLETAAHESHLGYYLHQVRGPAIGPYQMETVTYYCNVDNFLAFRPELLNKINMALRCDIAKFVPEDMAHNLKLATIMCRIKYLRSPEPLPKSDDVRGMAEYWKKNYNSGLGKGTVDDFVCNYNKFLREYFEGENDT